MVFRPALKVQPMTSMSVQVEWNEFKFNPNYYVRSGGVYVAYTVSVKNGPGGYFGVQIQRNRGKFSKDEVFTRNLLFF